MNNAHYQAHCRYKDWQITTVIRGNASGFAAIRCSSYGTISVARKLEESSIQVSFKGMTEFQFLAAPMETVELVLDSLASYIEEVVIFTALKERRLTAQEGKYVNH